MHTSPDHPRCRPSLARKLPDRFRCLTALGSLLLLTSCASPTGLPPRPLPGKTSLAPMFVADLGADITVADLDKALSQMEFVQELDGYIAAVDAQGDGSTGRLTVELRVPHKYTGRVAEILSAEFGEVTSINVLSGEVSVRAAGLRRRLAALERSLGGLSGTDLVEAKAQIELLQDIITFQLRRTRYLYVVVHLVQAP